MSGDFEHDHVGCLLDVVSIFLFAVVCDAFYHLE